MNVTPGFSLTDIGSQWFEDAVERLTGWFHDGLTDGYDDVTEAFLGTPIPETGDTFVFGAPQNEPWTDLHAALVGGEIMLVSLLLLIICVQGRHTVRIFNFGSAYEARKTRRGAWTGAFLIVTWYWVAVLSLYLVEGFTIALVPEVDTLMRAMIDFLEVSLTNPALALLMAMVGGFAMWVLQALFFIREILLYVYLYAMPIGLAIAFGGIPIASRVAKNICMKFVPLAILPLPVAVFFRGYEVLFSEGTSAAVAPDSAFLSYLVGASLPVLSLIIVWKLFTYASPMTAKVIGGTTKAAVTTGAVVGAASTAGPAAAASAAKWGPKAGAAHATAKRFSQGRGTTNAGIQGQTASDGSSSGTLHDNIAADAQGQRTNPPHRRTKNDPGGD